MQSIEGGWIEVVTRTKTVAANARTKGAAETYSRCDQLQEGRAYIC